MEEKWVQQSQEISSVLGLEKKVIAISFTNEEIKTSGKARICTAIKKAGKGDSFVISEENSLCHGGSWHCGLTEPPRGKARRAIQRFLTQGEKLTASIVSFHRMQGLLPPPTGLAERILICPAEKAKIRPDAMLFLCNAEQACRLITLDHYWDGIPPSFEPGGSLCRSSIVYPIISGRTNATFGDWTARRMTGFSAETVFVTIPYERIENLLLAIPECSAGIAEVVIPEDLRTQFEQEES